MHLLVHSLILHQLHNFIDCEFIHLTFFPPNSHFNGCLTSKCTELVCHRLITSTWKLSGKCFWSARATLIVKFFLSKWNQSLLLTCPTNTSNFTLGMWVGTSSAGLWTCPFSITRQNLYLQDWISQQTISLGSSLTSAHGQLYKSCECQQLLPPHALLTYVFTCWKESGQSLHVTYRNHSLVPFYHNRAYIIKLCSRVLWNFLRTIAHDMITQIGFC